MAVARSEQDLNSRSYELSSQPEQVGGLRTGVEVGEARRGMGPGRGAPASSSPLLRNSNSTGKVFIFSFMEEGGLHKLSAGLFS